MKCYTPDEAALPHVTTLIVWHMPLGCVSTIYVFYADYSEVVIMHDPTLLKINTDGWPYYSA
jgi:hypothetical protein